MTTPLTLDKLAAAVRDGAAGIRSNTRMRPLGDEEAPVMPPTYGGGEYAKGERTVSKKGKAKKVRTVTLDSVASQARRFKLALHAAHKQAGGDLDFPVLTIDFANSGVVRRLPPITALHASHGAFDAYFRDSEIGGVAFEKHPVGIALSDADKSDITGVYRYAPHHAVTGWWHSNGPRTALGNKCERMYAARIIGVVDGRVPGTSSKIDPIGILSDAAEVYAAAPEAVADWTTNLKEAYYVADDKPVRIDKISSINHGTIPPSLHKSKNRGTPGEHGGDEGSGVLPYGVVLRHANLSQYLSLAGLETLGFGPVSPKQAEAARVACAALGVAGMVLAVRNSRHLRSGCDLVPDRPRLEIVGEYGDVAEEVSCDRAAAQQLVADAAAAADAAGIGWEADSAVLTPSSNLVDILNGNDEQGYLKRFRSFSGYEGPPKKGDKNYEAEQRYLQEHYHAGRGESDAG